LSLTFNQLIQRAENCQEHIQNHIEQFNCRHYSLIMPSAEPIMLQAAIKKEYDASTEELLGNLNR
jgi:hypothetical protein